MNTIDKLFPAAVKEADKEYKMYRLNKDKYDSTKKLIKVYYSISKCTRLVFFIFLISNYRNLQSLIKSSLINLLAM